MADEKVTLLVDVEVDNQSAQKNLEETTRRIEILKKERQALNTAIKKGNGITKEQAQALTAVNQALKQETAEQKKYNKQVNTTSNSLNAMRQRLIANKQALGDIDQSTKKGALQFRKLSKETDALNSKILAQEKGYGVATRQVGAYEKAQGALSAASPRAASAFQQVGVALRFLLSPIGLIVTGVALLLKAFTSTREGGQKLSASMDAIATVVQKVFDTIAPLGEAIFKNLILPMRIAFNTYQAFKKLISGDFSGALDEMNQNVDLIKDSFTTWVDAIEEVAENINKLDGEELSDIAKEAYRISLAFEKLGDQSRVNTIELEKQRQELENLRVASRNVALSEEERLALATQIEQKEREVANVFDEQIRIAKAKLVEQRKLNALANSSTEDLEKEADLEKEVNNLIAQKTRKLLEAGNATARLNKQAQQGKQKEDDTAEKELQKAKQASEKLRVFREQQDIKDIEDLDEKLIAEQALIQSQAQFRIDNEQLTQDEILLIQEQSEAKQLELAERSAKSQKEVDRIANENKVAIASGALGAIAGLFEQESKQYKILASAQATVDTYAAANAAFRSGSAISPVFGAISAGSAVIAGLANVAKNK